MIRFLKYTAVTLPTFTLDLIILVVLKSYLGVNYILAAGIAFLIATTTNYILSRHFVFAGTHCLSSGYVYFLAIALAGLGLVTGSLWFFVGILHFNYIVSRLLIAAFEGTWNYLMNLYFNFRINETSLVKAENSEII